MALTGQDELWIKLAGAKVVGPELGTKPRKVEMTMEEFETLLKQQ